MAFTKWVLQGFMYPTGGFCPQGLPMKTNLDLHPGLVNVQTMFFLTKKWWFSLDDEQNAYPNAPYMDDLPTWKVKNDHIQGKYR